MIYFNSGILKHRKPEKKQTGNPRHVVFFMEIQYNVYMI